MTVDSKPQTACDLVVQAPQRANRAGVETGSVGNIKDLPGKAQGLFSMRLQDLGQAAILLEVTIAAENVALAVFTRIWIAQRSATSDAIIEGIGIGKDLGQSLRVDVPLPFDRARGHDETLLLVIGGISVRRKDVKRQPTRPAGNTRQRPSTNQGIRQAIGIASKSLSPAKGKLIDKVASKQMECTKTRE